MSDITPASTNVLYHGDVNFKNPTPVIELYPRAYGQQDEFVPAEGGKGNRRNPSFLGSFLKYLAITGAVVFAGRKGLFGKKIKGLLGGGPKTLNLQEVYSRIETKMADYLDGVEEKFAQVAGRTKDAVTSAKIITAADGTAVLRAEYQSGKIKEYTVKHGNNNVIKLIGEGSEEMNSTFRKLFGRKGRKENLNIEEYILFDKADGAVKYRTEIARIPGGKVRGYFSYKGEDVLDPAFREDLNKYKDFIAAREKKKFWLFGPKIEKTAMKFYNDPVSGNPTVVKTKRTYKKGVRREMVRDYGSMIRKFIYNKDGKLIDTIEKP